MRIISRPWAIAFLCAAALLQTNHAVAASSAPMVRINAVVKDGSVRLEAQAAGPFDYAARRQSDTLFVVDLTGVSVAEANAATVLDSNLVRGYRIVRYEDGGTPAAHVELLIGADVEPRLERTDAAHLTLIVSPNDSAVASKPAAAVSKDVPPATKGAELGSNSSSWQSISGVRVADDAGKTTVNVLGSGPLNYHVARLSHPERLVLDFDQTHLRAEETHVPSSLAPVRQVRLAQFSPEVTRVVIDLNQQTPYKVVANGNIVTAEFKEEKNSNDSDPIAPPPAEDVASAARPTAPADISKSNSLALPANLTQPTSALASPLPNTDATNRAEDKTSALVPAPAQPVAAQGGIAVAGGEKYLGEPISVNLKDVDLRDFFRLIHEISSLNVVVDPGVKGNLTIVLDNVPWDQALDIVLKNNDLEKQLDGNVLRIATKETMKREAEEERDLAKAQAEAADVVTTTRVLSYAKADQLVVTLKKFLSSRGDVLADTRSNTLIIRDVPEVIPVMDNLIRQLDRKTQQVEIEARVVEASRTFSREFGSQLGLETFSNSLNNLIGGNDAVGASPITRTPAPPLIDQTGGASSSASGAMPLITNFPTSVAPTSGLTYLYTAKNWAIDFLIDAAESKGVGKLLSKPKVITQNNQVAVVKQGTKLPVQTIVNNTVSVQFIDVVLQLQVTPQITADGNVFMDVIVTNDQIDQSIPRVQGIPAIDTQSAQTKVLVADGGTVVIGGIIVSNQQTEIDQVPLLGSLPIIGNLFKHQAVSSTSQELLFFLTPRIMPS